MMQSQDRVAVALSARTLGGVVSLMLLAASRLLRWLPPCATAAGKVSGPGRSRTAWRRSSLSKTNEPLADAWQRLFIGPWALPAPPWGSVWLDKESLLFGDSTLALREWMRANGVGLSEQRAEPEDHFGTLLLLAAWLCGIRSG
ncbi:oxidoreductase component of anaerobic dehydrogenases, Functional role page for Chaperone protein TorD [Klebsiella michiganensis]|uniref:Oxidoreductase component of anaerobic dehydrogenases, Functional role page for Chaperone protein TorD n=1 Tax=Klebsiella michiganensis TaxID=1134687 RepID=A0A7H4PM73_9ENTR|nr:oxidoreductase component of anaerobic dehydrogenases, Functional role page for Chaperone protein TorD [Klebsiella michiganensis]